MRLVLFALFATFGVAMPARAYIGPGAGLGAIVLTIGLGVVIFLLIAGLIWYPLKRLLGLRKTHRGSAASGNKKN